jgi:hypothetical protein
MRSWEIFSRSIYRLVARRYLQKIRLKSFGSVLRDSVKMLDPHTLEEIKLFVKNQQTPEGGFADKGGRCDLYYTLFGFFISEALEINEVMPGLKGYVKNITGTDNLKGLYLNCAIILYTNLFGSDNLPAALKRKPNTPLHKHGDPKATYADFIDLLTYYYSEDYFGFYYAHKRIRSDKINPVPPCPVTSAHLILRDSFGYPVEELVKQLHSFYRSDGSFSAIRLAPAGDLLSTGVALYALRFVNSDLRIIKPECLAYIDSLYSEGGFCANSFDLSTDVEYTFYGLLALGALSD